MSILDVFSKRQKRLRGDVPDVYTYDILPQTLRTQIVHIWFDALGADNEYFSGQVRATYELVVDALCREYGLFRLPPAQSYGERQYQQELINFLLNESDTERILDVVETSFRAIATITTKYHYLGRYDAATRAQSAIDELNARFQEHGIGYQFADGEIIRIDSSMLHSEVVKPALRLLSERMYAGAQQEFLRAHEHYRHGREKEALNECLKALESVMKSICDKRKWVYPKAGTAKDLIQVCLDNGLIPLFWQQHFSSLRSMLESSVPTGRNKLGGHGQGAQTVAVPPQLVSYMLHMTASTIVFLADTENALR